MPMICTGVKDQVWDYAGARRHPLGKVGRHDLAECPLGFCSRHRVETSHERSGVVQTPFLRTRGQALLFPRGPQAMRVCSPPDLCFSLGDSPVGPKFLCLLMGFNVSL